MSDLDELMRLLRSRPPAGLSLSAQRALHDRAESAFALPSGVRVRPWRPSDPSLHGEMLDVEDAVPERIVLYLHGGGYTMGSCRSHRHLAAAVGLAARSRVVLLDYRLAPEHPFPAALQDAVAAIAALHRDAAPAARLAVVGDSAGGGLALAAAAAAHAAHAAGTAWPLAIAALSPLSDIRARQRSPAPIVDDPLVDESILEQHASAYLAGAPRDDPRASPVLAELAGLPALLIQAGSTEYLLPDAVAMAQAAQRQGVQVTLDVTPGTPHVCAWFWPRLAAGRAAVERIGAFLEAHLA